MFDNIIRLNQQKRILMKRCMLYSLVLAMSALCAHAQTVTVTPAIPVNPGGSEHTIYLGYGPQSVTLTASGGVSYLWSSDPAGFSSTAASVVVSPTSGTLYLVNITDENNVVWELEAGINVVDVRCGNNNDKVLVCHKEKNTLCIGSPAVAAHLANHDDKLGACFEGPMKQGFASSPDDVLLEQNYPNPVRGETTISYPLPENSHITLRVLDMLGGEGQRLIDGVQQAGMYATAFRAEQLPNGTYRYELTLNGETINRFMIVAR